MESLNRWREIQNESGTVKKYQHIDNPLDLRSQKDFKVISSAVKNLNKHQFLPFLKRVQKRSRFQFDEEVGHSVRKMKNRPIMYASHKDAHIYGYYNFLLYSKYEDFLYKNGIDDVVLAYRRIENKNTGGGKCNIEFAQEVFSHIKNHDSCFVVTQDISSFFENLNHKHLKNTLCKVLSSTELPDDWYRIFKSLTKYRYLNYEEDFIKGKVREKIRKDRRKPVYKHLQGLFKENTGTVGIPQGSPISGLFANIYMLDFDIWFNKKYPNIFYRRYSDDILFVCPKETNKQALINDITTKILEYKLDLQPKKTFVTTFTRHDNVHYVSEVEHNNKAVGRTYLDYLGFEFDGKNVYFRKSSIQRFNVRQRARVKKKIKQFNSPKKSKRKKITSRTKTDVYRGASYYKRSINILESDGVTVQYKQMKKNVRKIKNKLLNSKNE